MRSVCPDCGWVRYRQLKVGAGVLVQQDGALLLVQRGPGSDAFAGAWNLPAGYCEVDEPPSATAARETLEETGLHVEVVRLVNAYFFDDDLRGNGLLLVYEAGVLGGALQSDGIESAAIGFFLPEDLPEPLSGGGHDQAVLAWRAQALDRWQPGSPIRYCPHCTHPVEEKMAFDRLRTVCVACGFVDFRSPKVGVSLLVEDSQRVLLIRRAVEPGLGKWCLPSGFVEWDESPEAAAVRECVEETGLVIANLRLLEVIHYTDDYRGPGINLTYQAQVVGGALQPGDDAGEARFFLLGELPPDDGIAFQSHRQVLAQWREDR
jgi:8-oxo-dGTP diphosphatase